ncbi:hypothetical protein AVEN_7418-1 [Araneus ventricosus]|uniref:DUF5641 domain-containing protein n=1 Tax=Araneus ventricosus TaxID=182803 RepID=A0A4Y2H2R2_ARAVE|nr:hypothetical protein AVEN_7418-1 [Araneus ventricosus]
MGNLDQKSAVGSIKLAFEEFLLLTTKIYSILNSRPLSADPHDYTALTPGHFVIGRPMTSNAEAQLIERSDNYLSRWQKITEKLETRHLRYKWQFAKDNVKPIDLVPQKHSDFPPYKWRLGRIQESIKDFDSYENYGVDDKNAIANVLELSRKTNLSKRFEETVANLSAEISRLIESKNDIEGALFYDLFAQIQKLI